MTTNIAESRRPRPEAAHSAREIHFFVLHVLDGIRDRCATLARRSAERAALAVELATTDDSPGRNLKRALTAIRTSMVHCDTLCARKIIDRQVHDYLRRRVDQLVAGIEVLKTRAADQWPDLPLPPLEAEPTEESGAAPLTLFQSVMERLAQTVRSVMPRHSPHEAVSQPQPIPGDTPPRGKAR
jgi:hypothetical protein